MLSTQLCEIVYCSGVTLSATVQAGIHFSQVRSAVDPWNVSAAYCGSCFPENTYILGFFLFLHAFNIYLEILQSGSTTVTPI